MDAHDKVNILMVDDQPAKLLSYEVILRELGENLIPATSGREALAHLLHTDIAVVLMDVHMPEIDGFELAAMIHQHPRYQQTAIIFISGVHLSDRDMLRGYEHGAVDYITVPIIPELLRAKVRVFAELYRKTAALQREIAERQRLEREALRAQHFLLLGRLAVSVSHEIRNPLSAITLHVELLQEELCQPSPNSAEVMAQSFTEITTQLGRLHDLVQDYLSLARVATIERTPQDLGATVETWAHEWQRWLRRKGSPYSSRASRLWGRRCSSEHPAPCGAQPGAERARRHAPGGHAYPGRPGHGDPGAAIRAGHRKRHPRRAATPYFRAFIYDETGRDGVRPVYCAGDSQSACGRDYGAEC